MYPRLLLTSFSLINSAWGLTIQPRNYLASGEARYYDLATGAQTTCGGYHSTSEMVCAVGGSVFGQGHRCGQSLVIYYGSKRVACILDDKCPSCAGNSLDLSPAVFKALAPLSQGVLPVHWHFA